MERGSVDAVIVGAGASGGIVAKELAAAGWRVALLERGPWLETFGHLETRDAWFTGIDRPPFGPARGVPVSRITYRQHENNADWEQFMAERSADLLREAGAKSNVTPRIVRESAAGISTHQLGSCRMGTDPASSVTDRTGRVHSVPNVYIADGSLLVNPGGANPSLTIQAYWVSAAMVRSHRP